MSDEISRWDALKMTTHMHTITFRYPKRFRKAVAASLGRMGDTATLSETEEFIREAVRLNIDALIEEHLGRTSSLKVRVRKRSRP